MAKETAGRPVADGFLGRLDEVVQSGVSAIWEDLSSYSRLGPAFMDDLREAVAENVAILARVLSQGREIRRDELRAIERVGAQRAEAGIPLEDVLHAYRTVSRVSWDVLADECRAFSGDGLEAAIELAEAVLRYTDQISTAVADAYARAERAIIREQEGARREFLADLLQGAEASPEDLLRRARRFGLDFSLSYIALVGKGPEADPRKEANVAAASAAASQGSADPIVLQKGEHTIALIPVEPSSDPHALPEKLVAELDGEWRFGMGGPDPGLKGIRRSYIEAREALEIAEALKLAGPVHRFDDLLLYHFLRVEPALAKRFVDQALGPLIDYDKRRKGELIKTLEAYFSVDGSVKMTGKVLFAHPHTVSYRLKQIERLTSWSLHHPESKLRLQLALRAYRMMQARFDGEG